MAVVVVSGQEVCVDVEDLSMVLARNWHVTREGYASTGRHLMHRMLCGLSVGDGLVVDHRNGNRLDNRRSNLRVCTRSQNAANKRPSKVNVSGVVGVWWAKKLGKWAVPSPSGKRAYFQDKEHAVEFKELMQEMVHGEYAYHLSR
jgi:hypothetical protein